MSITVWCFWYQGIDHVPPFTAACLCNWRTKLPTETYTIRMLDYDMFCTILDDIQASSPRQEPLLTRQFLATRTVHQVADIVRLFVLYHFGGIWVDCTTLLLEDFGWVLREWETKQLVVFGMGDTYLWENWFLAAGEPKLALLKTWLETFVTLLREMHDHDNSCEQTPMFRSLGDTSILTNPQYLSMHLALLYCFQTHPTFRLLAETDVTCVHSSPGPFPFGAYPLRPVTTVFHLVTRGLGVPTEPTTNQHLIKFRKGDTWLCRYLPSHHILQCFQDHGITTTPTMVECRPGQVVTTIVVLSTVFTIAAYLLKTNTPRARQRRPYILIAVGFVLLLLCDWTTSQFLTSGCRVLVSELHAAPITTCPRV
jgi:hypothetical protein